MPVVTIPPLPAGTPITARFTGGPMDGREMAVPDARMHIEFPVQTSPRWYAADLGSLPTLSTVVYSATTRTVTAGPIWNAMGAANYTIQIEYTAAGTVTDAYAADGTWLGHANDWHVQMNNQPWPQAPPITPEQEAVRARKQVRQQRRKVLAHKRARRLLLNLLSEEQQHEYAHAKAFTVTAKNGKVFRLRKGKTAELLGTDGAAIAAYCIHLPYGYNDEDTLIALLLSLQTDPAEFEQTANVTRLRPRNFEVREQVAAVVAAAAVNMRGMADAMREAGEAARHAAEHVRESQAMLRAEGLSDAEVESLREWPNHESGILVAA